jgi:hypothetical protein
VTDTQDVREIGIRAPVDAGLAQSQLASRNLRFGWALFFLFWLLFAGTFLVAVLYLQLD